MHNNGLAALLWASLVVFLGRSFHGSTSFFPIYAVKLALGGRRRGEVTVRHDVVE